MGTSELPIAGEVAGVAVDSSGNIYAGTYSGTVFVFSPSGAPITSFSIAVGSGNLAVGPEGTVYVVNDGSGEFLNLGTHRYAPSEFPIGPPTTYTAKPKVVPSGSPFPYGVGVDPANGEFYILETTVTNSWIAIYDNSGTLLRYIGQPGEEGESSGISQGVAVVGGGNVFQVYMGTNEDGGVSKVSVFGEDVEPGPPTIVSTSATDVTAASATLRATINPNTAETAHHFEYGLEDCSVSVCTSVPVGGGKIPAGHRPVQISQKLIGLIPGTTYHYRVLAENSFGPELGPDRTFTTQVTGIGFRLPDGRAWEMVSPADKLGARLGLRPGPIQASLDGSRLAYQSFPSIEADPQGSRETASILGQRQGDGSWRSKDISSPNDEAAPPSVGGGGEYRLFSSDLSEALVEPGTELPLSPEATEGTPYLRDNSEPGIYTPLVTGAAPVPPGTQFGGQVSIVGASPDFRHVGLRSGVPLVEGPEAGANLYEWFDGQVEPVSVLPSGEGVVGLLGSAPGSVRGAMSENSRVFWSTGAYGTSNDLTGLYVRDLEADESARIDVVSGGSGSGIARPTFQGASADGTVVFFTDTRAMTADSSPSGADLYRCELPAGSVASGCSTLTNVSVPTEAGESANIQGVALAISGDGSSTYFVAEGVLADDPNTLGDSAVSGQPNLYLWEQGEGIRFLATLAEEDSLTWGATVGSSFVGAVRMSAAASPGNSHLIFSSQRSLTGYDNGDAVTGEPLSQIFRYDAAADRLDCISCNPSGGSPRGRVPGSLVDPMGVWSKVATAMIPEAFSLGLNDGPTLTRPRSVSEAGRVFFNAFDSLVPADSNGEWDVYQYEPTGVGDCTASSGGASIVRSAGGCVSLISSGTAEEVAVFLDASASGDDAFFLTTAKLSVLDKDQELDAYDARVGGITATLDLPRECLGEACQPAVVAPSDPTPGSATFHGPGNEDSSADCAALSKRADKVSRQARRARSEAAAAKSPAAARGAQREARRLTQRAKALSQQAKRCKRSDRRAAR